MGVPKSKTSRMRARRRRAHLKVIPPNLEVCPQCGATKLPHRICPECGYYRGLKLIKTKSEIKAEREERRKKEEEMKKEKEKKE
jgi:large subunit ribosomal protein L32